MSAPSRNDPCPCGSGKKYKQCCLQHDEALVAGKHAGMASIPKAFQSALVLHQAGRLPQAEAIYRQILQVVPNHPDALHFLGAIAYHDGNNEAAVELISKAISVNPSPSMHYNLGNALQAQGNLDAAAESYRKALVLRPDYAEAHTNLGNALQAQEYLDAAAESYRKALALKPDLAVTHYNLGNVLQAQGKLKEAVASYHRALMLKPDNADVHYNLGNALQAQGKLDEAVESYHMALTLKPDNADAHYNLGIAFKAQGKLGMAVEHYRKALVIKPDCAEIYLDLGNALRDLGQLDDAVASCRQALQIKPDFADVHNNLLFALNYHPDLSAEEIYRAYQEYDAMRGIPLHPTWRTHGNDKNPDRRLRVGYVSPDFRNHSCSSFLEPLLAHHDKTRIEVYAYAELVKEDDMTSLYQSYVEHWISTKGMSDEALAERIRNDRIDILVELAGHTAGNRLLTFARKPAPVSLSWLGYGYTTGLSAIDYYLTDEASAPMGSDGLFAEHPWRIATPAYTYRPTAGMGEVGSLPAQQRGYITFGTLTRSVRINHRTIRAWAEILKAVPNSCLVMDSSSFKDPAMQERMAMRFAEHGITPDRLEIGFNSPPWDTLRSIDIGLDCFPHNSGTTLFETLYMGIPYITLAGRPSVGRLGSSILQGAGHPEWIAGSEDDYVAKAVELASDVNRLSKIRSVLRDQMEGSPLRDEEGFACKVEDAYRRMWKIWCERGGNT